MLRKLEASKNQSGSYVHAKELKTKRICCSASDHVIREALSVCVLPHCAHTLTWQPDLRHSCGPAAHRIRLDV